MSEKSLSRLENEFNTILKKEDIWDNIPQSRFEQICYDIINGKDISIIPSTRGEVLLCEIGDMIKHGGGGDYPYYTGTYEVSPDSTEQQLKTKNTILRNDVTVHKIKYNVVDNESGLTVYIGGNE